MGFGNNAYHWLLVRMRIRKYRLLSDCQSVSGRPHLSYPLLLKGKGRVTFGNEVKIGVEFSPGFYSGYGYMEARFEDSIIEIGSNVRLNNGFSMVAAKKVSIGGDTLIGINFTVADTDFHHLDPKDRFKADPPSEEVVIGKNVFICSNVSVLKGVTIGDNSVIGSNSVVTKDIPANTVAAGNPAKIIRQL